MAFTEKLNSDTNGYSQLPESFEEVNNEVETEVSTENVETITDDTKQDEVNSNKEVTKENIINSVVNKAFKSLPEEFGGSEDGDENEINSKSKEGFHSTLGELINNSIEIINFNDDELKDLNETNFEEKLAGKIQDYLQAQKDNIKDDVVNNFRSYLSKNDVKSSSEELLNNSDEKIREDVDFAENIIRHYYSNVKGLDSDTVETIVSNEVDIEERALKLNIELKQIEEAKKEQMKKDFDNQELQKKQAFEKEYSSIQNKINALDESFPNLGINSSLKLKVLNNAESYWKEINENFTDYGPKIALFKELGFFDNNFEILTKKAKSNALSKMQKVLNDR